MIKIIYMSDTLMAMSHLGIDISPIIDRGVIKETKIGRYLVIEEEI